MSGQLEIRQRFVTEGELEEKRRKRQEEWERVRKPEDPLEQPEEVYDPRSLFEKLQEQKERKQAEFEEPLKFKNQVRGLEEDEAGFLSGVEAHREATERARRHEELIALQEYHESVHRRGQEEVGIKCHTLWSIDARTSMARSRLTQTQILAGAVKRKSTDSKEDTKRRKIEKEKPNKAEGAVKSSQVENARASGALASVAIYTDSDSESDGGADVPSSPLSQL
uniref:Proteasome activator subunit 3 interacting protein 1 n=1 Tax=Eptatretus burgeri TaxID=7764 RepID=A0A8C4R8I4_EPTBU